MLEKINGVIIKTHDYSETHKIITIFSKKIGKFTALARGAKKPKSRMAALTQPFIYGEFFVYISKGLSTLQQGDVVNSFRAIREDIIKTAYAAYIAELTDKLLDTGSPEYYLYEQFYKTLDWISENEDLDIPVIMYELKLYKKAGFAPFVDYCVNCREDNRPYSFSVQEGGLLCDKCKSSTDPYAVRLPDGVAKLLYMLVHVGIEQVGNIAVKRENKELLRKLLDSYYDRYGGYYLKSRKVLNQLHLLK
ncbi:DNA repair protein RecO [Virgibacillus sp. MSJ-26]|uniref:DNA repair protein RecO n=1 Tax=Virgibacillus sp. MSJ-26 TaxID=2841522 RepID=UPI001C0FFEAE|nr:DNA repair protein RecO [Virgibacillus sp. MSJ-26]